MKLPLVKECDRCDDLMCRGDWRTCRGALFQICASMELAAMSRDMDRDLELARLRDRHGQAA